MNKAMLAIVITKLQMDKILFIVLGLVTVVVAVVVEFPVVVTETLSVTSSVGFRSIRPNSCSNSCIMYITSPNAPVTFK